MLINLRTSTYVKWSNVNLGSFGVTGVKRSFPIKNAVTCKCYIAWPSKTHTCWSAWDLQPMIWGQMSIWCHRGDCPDLFTDLVNFVTVFSFIIIIVIIFFGESVCLKGCIGSDPHLQRRVFFLVERDDDPHTTEPSDKEL